MIPPMVHERRGDGLVVLDVRSDGEWEDELHRLPDGGVDVAVICSTGYRSTVAASVLERNGYTTVPIVLFFADTGFVASLSRAPTRTGTTRWRDRADTT